MAKIVVFRRENDGKIKENCDIFVIFRLFYFLVSLAENRKICDTKYRKREK